MRIQFVRLAMWLIGRLSRHKLTTSILFFLFQAARWLKKIPRQRPLLTVAAALVCASVLLAQLPFIQIVQPPPPSVTGAGAAYVGPSGGVPIYYWVVARYPVGSSAYPTGPIPAINTQGVGALGGGSTVTVTWQAAVGATGYDVLRSTTTQVPIPCSLCAIALDTALLTVTDTGADGSAYPPGGLTVAQTAMATLAVNNRDESSPFAYIQIGSTIVPLLPGLAPVSSVFGRTGAVVAAIGDYAFSQISSTLSLSQIAAGDKQGNGAKIQMFGGGAVATDDCMKFDANGNAVSAGAACGSIGTVSSVFGRTGAVVAALNDYAFNLLSGTLALSQIASGDKQGNGTKIQMFGTGTPATNDCAKFDANGNVVSAGAACGSSGGSFTAGTGIDAGELAGDTIAIDQATVSPMPLFGQAVINFPEIAAEACAESAVTVTGADTGDAASVKLPGAFTAGLTATAYISAANTATVRLCNPTASPINPDEGTFGVVVQQLTWVADVIFNVGPGLAYEDIADVPWDTLTPGSEVRIHWKATPYKEKWHIGKSGTYAAPIRVRGIRNSLGQRPVIDANLAVAVPGQSYWNEDRGVIKIGGPSIGSATVSNVVIEGLEIYGARLGNTFYPLVGGLYPYLDNAAAVYVEGPAEFIVVRDCYLHENGDGIFASTSLKWMTIEVNHIYKNGYSGSSQEHNSYVQGTGTVYQFNTYEHDDNWEGNNIKDRGVFTVIRYNEVINGNRTMDLVDSPEQVTYNYPVDSVYGNVLIKGRGYNNNQIVHYGYDLAAINSRRNLRFYSNTIINKRMSPGNNEFVLFQLDTATGTNYAYNNAFWAYTPGQPNSYYGGDLVSGPGTMTWYYGWIYQGDCSNPVIYCTRPGSGFVDGGGNIWAGSADPYINQDTGNITSALSPLISAATTIPSTWLAVRYQFGTPGNRVRSAVNDIGAFEY